jgi:hypothetical protein
MPRSLLRWANINDYSGFCDAAGARVFRHRPHSQKASEMPCRVGDIDTNSARANAVEPESDKPAETS